MKFLAIVVALFAVLATAMAQYGGAPAPSYSAGFGGQPQTGFGGQPQPGFGSQTQPGFGGPAQPGFGGPAPGPYGAPVAPARY